MWCCASKKLVKLLDLPALKRASPDMMGLRARERLDRITQRNLKQQQTIEARRVKGAGKPANTSKTVNDSKAPMQLRETLEVEDPGQTLTTRSLH